MRERIRDIVLTIASGVVFFGSMVAVLAVYAYIFPNG